MVDFQNSNLARLGFQSFFLRQWTQLRTENGALATATPARISSDRGQEYLVESASGSQRATLSGRLQAELGATSRPSVGDWVLIDDAAPTARIRFKFERTTVLTRKSAGNTSAGQVIAANVDVAFVVAALAPTEASVHVQRRSLNFKRLRRYLRLVSEAGLRAVVVVNKADLDANARQALDDLRKKLREQTVVLVSALTGQGLDELSACLGDGETAVLIGSSGVGKSSLVNQLLGAKAQLVSEVREEDARGRHTTTSRDLFSLPAGGCLIDTPGMRELALWADQDTEVSNHHSPLEEFADQCRFRDCRHENEPGCAVREALERGALDAATLRQERRLTREIELQRQRHDALARHETRKQRRVFAKTVRRAQSHKRGGRA